MLAPGAGTAASSLSRPDIYQQQCWPAKPARYLGEVQYQCHATPACSSLDDAQGRSQHCAAGPVDHRVRVQPGPHSHLAAGSLACLPQKRLRLSPEGVSASCIASRQDDADGVAAIDSSDLAPATSGQHLGSEYGSMPSGLQSEPSDAPLWCNPVCTVGFLHPQTSPDRGHGHAMVMTGSAILDDTSDCLGCPTQLAASKLMNSRTASLNSNRGSTAPEAASMSAGRPHSESGVHMSHGQPTVRLNYAQHELQMAGLLQDLAVPISGDTSCPLTQRLLTLKSINRMRGIAAQSPKFQALYRRNIQVTHCPCC